MSENDDYLYTEIMNPIPKKVIVAMSGGVDSSVAAALLKKQGYDVIGITMQIWPKSRCCSLSDIDDARRVAAKLDIPYYVLNFRDLFKEKVIANFINEYKNGRTPNPCIRCNELIKFEALRQKAKELGADFLATGHYARIKQDNGHYLLLKGRDEQKDQSYFLYTMTQEQLAATIFPLSEFTKEESREIAKELGLRVANKPESQEICFVPDNNYRHFLKDFIKEKEGPIYDYQGKRIGTHQGVLGYTIGQRKGLGISWPEPLYVISINKDENAITVGSKELLFKKELIAADVNFISQNPPKEPIKASVQIRYNMRPQSATVEPLSEEKVKVIFDDPVSAITPGQAAVFYKDDVVIGGGTIENPLFELRASSFDLKY